MWHEGFSIITTLFIRTCTLVHEFFVNWNLSYCFFDPLINNIKIATGGRRHIIEQGQADESTDTTSDRWSGDPQDRGHRRGACNGGADDKVGEVATLFTLQKEWQQSHLVL
jgi:hypothetical protein